ncbi:MAG: hypothetical protein Q8K33_01425 [Cypionkella sp.]|uniref:hypothetical protein n=1 Tax=Cypionkella sp. TaxID=2811411 RepID=UPI00272F66A8|nr:hypothetical protein [Cypionkella sp.]MDP2047541.1 hypothetical protein [Cypionkella sp.]
MTTTTREAALEAAAKNLVWAAQTSGGTAGRDEGLVAACDQMEAALSTPATEPQGQMTIADFVNTLKTDDNVARFMNQRICCDGHMCGCMGSTVGEYLGHCALSPASRPDPQPVAEHEYPDPLIAEDRYEDDQPAADTRVVASLLDPNAVHLNMLRGTIAMPSVSQIKHIYGDAITPAPSDKTAEAAIDRCMQEIEDIICEADVSYPAGRDAGTSIDFDRDAVLAALRALAGKGE